MMTASFICILSSGEIEARERAVREIASVMQIQNSPTIRLSLPLTAFSWTAAICLLMSDMAHSGLTVNEIE
jgi:hypothetical protein